MKTIAIVLAAGYGKRLGGLNQKTLTRILGKPLLLYLVETLKQVNLDRIIIVVGFHKEKVFEEMEGQPVEFVEQKQLLGTGHAVMTAEKALSDFQGNLLILCGDVPFIRTETIKKLVQTQAENDADCVLLTANFPDPYGYGRILRNGNGSIKKIVEEVNASEEEKKIKEINAGVYVFKKEPLFTCLKTLEPDPVKKEYYLTDVVGKFILQGKKVYSWTTPMFEEVIGINTSEDLKKAEEYLLKLRCNNE